MRITDLHIYGFGHFADRRFGPVSPRVTVFYGPNEAGKTTLLEFTRAILFGFLDGRSGRSRNRYLPLAGGRHGGSITAQTDAGETVTIRRTSGRAGGTVALTADDGASIPSTELDRLLGNHSRGAFEKLFAFTVDELHDAGLLSDDSVNSQIYGAGLGVSNLSHARNSLNGRKQELFLHRGSSQRIYHTANQIDDVNSSLSQVQNNAADYRQGTDRLADLDRQLSNLRERRRTCDSDLRFHRNLEQAWNSWNEMVIAENRLIDLPTIEFPTNGVSRLETLQARADSAREERDAVAARVRDLERAVATPIEHETLLEQSAAIRDLERSRAAFDQSIKDIPERQTELATIRAARDNALADLGPDWDAERLAFFDLSIVARQDVSDHTQRLADFRGTLSNARNALAASETAVDEAFRATERAREELNAAPIPSFDEDGLLDRRSHLRRARTTLDEYARIGDRVQGLRAQLDGEPVRNAGQSPDDTSRLLAILVGAAGLGALALSVGFGEWVGVVAGVALVLIAAYLFIRSRPKTHSVESSDLWRDRNPLADVEERLANLRAELEQASSDLGVNALDQNALNDAETALDTEQSRLSERSRLSAASRRADDLLSERSVRHAAAVTALEQARTALDSAQSEWRQWLDERGLRDSFSPENIEVLARAIDLARARHNEFTDMRRRIAAIQTDIKQFTDDLEPLAAPRGFDLPTGDHARAAVVADEIIELRHAVSEQARARDAARNDLQSARVDLNERERRLSEAQARIEDLLAAAAARDVEHFLSLDELHRERREHTANRDAARDQIQRISGPGTAFDDLTDALSQSNMQTIADDISAVERELDDIDSEIERLAAERGSIQRNLDDLLGEEESTKLRADSHRLQETIRGHAREWAVLTIAENLLREAQSKFERERQPDVINHSTELFRRITNGRYETVYAPLGTSEIRVTDAAGASKQPSELSRGTREQLFLALRFGLIREMGQRSERLPMIIDEALINFDPDRALNAAKAFIELSETNQALVFTCHPWMVETFQQAAAHIHTTEPEIVEIG